MSTKRTLQAILFVVSLLATVFVVVGFATPEWIKINGMTEKSLGLWEDCLDGVCTSNSMRPIPGWFIVVEILMCFGLIFTVFGLLFGVAISLGVPVNKDKSIRVLLASCMFAVTLLSISCLVFLIQIPKSEPGFSMGYSFVLELVGILLIVAEMSLAYWLRAKHLASY